MKTTFVLLFFLALISSCGNKQDEKLVCATKVDKKAKSDTETYEYWDSIYAQNIWYLCQGLINANKQEKYFKGSTDTTYFNNEGSSSVHGIVEITSAFNLKRKFAKVNRLSSMGFVYIDIIDLENKNQLLQEKYGMVNYIGDTIIDCNNDGYSDYVLKAMASNGCCPREDSWIYIYNPKTNKFNPPYDFLNVTYFSSQRMLIGMSYGRLNETYLFKLIFNGLIADTVEYLHHHPKDASKFILSKTDQIDLNKDKTIKRVPIVYKKAEGYNWFVGKL